MYATDIILLGNLNEDNLYGIPQFFKCLPSTTANIPPIATISEYKTEERDDESEKQYETSDDEIYADAESESGNTVMTTGMDWGRDSEAEHTLNINNGLFMDLACTYAGTKGKSCINVERLSELGVNLDTLHTVYYSHGAGLTEAKFGEFNTDGFINKLELDDMENRAMFATMNHIGFIPQPYQDEISGYTTQVIDENTRYLINKFKYIYQVDFDGRHTQFMNEYRMSGFLAQFFSGLVSEQPLYDETDESYLTFRLGAEHNAVYTGNTDERIRHFYRIDRENRPQWELDKKQYGRLYYHMPLYNNSFYFYFGIKRVVLLLTNLMKCSMQSASKRQETIQYVFGYTTMSLVA